MDAQPKNFHSITTTLVQYLIAFCFCAGLIVAAQASMADTPADHDNQSLSISSGKININKADANLLASTLKGVGMSKARSIIEYRDTYGPFSNIQELADVSGIGTATLEKNADLIVVK